MPIRWAEPFGMVMIEALASGTPVIAFRAGAAPEIVDDGATGFLVADEIEMARAIGQLSSLDGADCRRSTVRRFHIDRVAEAYENAYLSAISPTRRPTRPSGGTLIRTSSRSWRLTSDASHLPVRAGG